MFGKFTILVCTIKLHRFKYIRGYRQYKYYTTVSKISPNKSIRSEIARHRCGYSLFLLCLYSRLLRGTGAVHFFSHYSDRDIISYQY